MPSFLSKPGRLARAAKPVVSLLSRQPLSRLVLLAVVLSLLAVWGGVGALLWSRWHDAVAAEMRQNANLATVLQEQTLRVIAAADQATLRLQDLVRDGSFEPADLSLLANETGLAPKILVQLSLVGADGRFVGSNLDIDGRRTGRLDLGDREHVSVHLKPEGAPEGIAATVHGGLFIGKPVLGKVSGRWTIQLSRRVAAADGRTLGVVVASLDPGYFEDVYRGVALGAQGLVSLLGDDRVVRARVVGGVSQGLGSQVGGKRYLDAETGQAIYVSAIDGVERIAAFRRIADIPLSIVVATATSEVLAEWRQASTVVVVVSVLFSATVLLAAWGFIAGVRHLERTNEALRASEAQAHSASRAKSAFLAHMSHEFRTPLNAVIGLSHLLAQMSLPERAGGFVRHIEQAGQQLLGLVSDVLDVSRIEAGQLQLDIVPFEVMPLLETVHGLVLPQAQAKGLSLRMETPPDLPACLVGDPLRIKQVLLNLLSNAVKFTPAGGVTLRVREVERTRRSLTLRFDVIDTGVGIPAEAQARIFEPFTQADSSTTRRFGGSGLGLSIVRRLVELMDGRLQLHSSPGEGSTFSVTLRLAQAYA
jgi:signal transduction histidine kinase